MRVSLITCLEAIPLLTLSTVLLAAPAPVLYFTDLVSGPNSGNSDSSQSNQIAGQDGAIVTVWGKNLGAGQSGSQILVGGQAARIYGWSNADHTAGPSDLYTRHGMQMVAFQIPNQVPSGATTIQAVVGGVATNSLPFIVRTGRLLYVKTSGDDTRGTGSWSAPWQTVSNAVAHMVGNDILYLGDGVQQTAAQGDRSTMNLEYGFTGAALSSQSAPKAMIAYPGAHVLIGNTAYASAYSIYVGEGSGNYADNAMYWTLSKITFTGHDTGPALSAGFRLVGSYVTAPLGDQQTGAVTGEGNDLYVLGNEVTQVGYSGTSKLYHPIYIQSAENDDGPARLPTESNREIGWNYLHDNYAYDGINIYREGTFSAYMANQRIHDNYILKSNGRGMLLGNFMTGDQNYVYNNIFINDGMGPAPSGANAGDPDWYYVCVDFSAGAVGNPETTIHFYNNTLYGCGFGGGPANTAGMVSVETSYPFTLDFRNNLVQSTGYPFVYPGSNTTAANASNNLWFGAGGPVPDPMATQIFAKPVTDDPKLLNPVAGDVHLQAGSAAIDAGNATTPVPSIDFDGVSRPQNGLEDIGAYEFPGTSAAPSPAIMLTKSVTPTTARPGDVVTFSIHYQNTGSVNATNVVVTDVIPTGSTFNPGSITGGGTLTGSTLIWTLGTVNANGSGSVSFQVTAD